jgi:ferredoxin--NADP+ reductase
MAEQNVHQVVVIGAGPAGIFAARALATAGVDVTLLNRDIKPGGLAEYGIYYDKCKMKEGLRRQFCQVLSNSQIKYLGNVTVGSNTGVSLEDVRQLGFDAVLVAVGAQGTKWLGLPGEEYKGVYHAKDLVYHYNKLPPFSTHEYSIGKRAALVGVGNVMMDIAHWLIREKKIDEVIAVARRGPAEVKFTRKEMEAIGSNLDLTALDVEIARVAPVMEGIGQDVAAAREYILSGQRKSLAPNSDTSFRFDFLASPSRILGNASGRACALDVEDTTLVLKDGDTKARGLGSKRLLEIDTVIFCIGDRVDETFGLPIQWNAFVKNPEPRFPVCGNSYEAFDPQAGQPIEGVFVAGWSREASTGLVGVARKDGECGAQAILQYLESLPVKPNAPQARAGLLELIRQIGNPYVTTEDIDRLEAYEQAEATRFSLEEFKLKTNAEMLAVMGLS